MMHGFRKHLFSESDINNTRNYTVFKETLEFEEYLINLDFKYMKNLCKFRCRSRHLLVNNGRFIGVRQADLTYNLFKSSEVGDEYHYLCGCSYFNAERTKFLGNGMILNPVTYKHLLNSRNASSLKQISKFIGLIFSKFVYMENIDRDVILLRDNVVTRSGRAVNSSNTTGSLIFTGYMLAACLLLVIEWHCCHCIFIVYSEIDVIVFIWLFLL